MKKEIAEKWVAALRSGAYSQVTGALTYGGNGYCCLGVLCQMAANEGATHRFESEHGGVYTYGSSRDNADTAYLPMDVRKWSGVGTHRGYVSSIDCSLATLNDNGKTFAEIADVIQTHVEAL